MNWKAILAICFSLFSLSLFGQILTPVTWETKVEALGGDEYELIFTANIDPGWNIYSQFTEDGGPVPTSFNFDAGDHYEKIGEVREEGKKKEGKDPLFEGVNVIKFVQGPVYFKQKVKASDTSKPIAGWLEFMCCDDEQCLPPTEVDFSFNLAEAASAEPATPNEEPKSDIPDEASASATAEANDETDVTASTDDAILAQASASEPKSEAQTGILDPVQWEIQVEQINESDYRLNFIANLDQGWMLYSQDNNGDGPIPTEFTFNGEGFETVGSTTEEGKLKAGFDPLFDTNVKKFTEGPVRFSQQVKVTDVTSKLTGDIYYMSCDDHQCTTPQEFPFTVSFQPLGISLGGEEENIVVEEVLDLGDNVYGNIPLDINSQDVNSCGAAITTIEGASNWRIFVLGFLGGLLALLTPCVFPMIPLTVSFFTKNTQKKTQGIGKAALYGGFIFLVYILLSLPFHFLDTVDPDILNQISSNVYLNLFFFAIFVFFAFSFFGYYELTLPSSWTNKASSAEGIGGVVGIFFMALTLALVSFSCTGPILGTLLAGALSSDGGAIQLTAGMGGFGLALALPFTVFAAFPQLMSSMPKSGGWLNSVKVVLGFAELGLAIKFLSNADLVDHWGFLRIEPFLISWIVIGLGLAAYLFTLISFPHDSKNRKPGIVGIGLGVMTLAFVAYLGSGFRVNPSTGSFTSLSLLSGLAPPVCYSYLKPCDCPQQLECFKDLSEGLAYAKKVNKPILLDFTGYTCVNCREMEENVWPTKPVYSQLDEEYVLISLYVDDKAELPENEQQVVVQSYNKGQKKKLRTVGKKWSHFQSEYFNRNTQPWYVLLSPDGQHLLNQPVGYTPNEEEYGEFLRCGLSNFQRLTEGELPAIKQLGLKAE